MTIQTKAQPGDNVFYMKDNKVADGVVDDVRITVQGGFGLYKEIKYSIRFKNDRLLDENEIHLSKQELLNSL